VPIEPILGARALEEARLLILGFIAIAAWGSAGLAWKTERVCIDDLQVEETTSSLIKGSGWDPVDNNRSKFEVELRTGKILSRTGAILQFRAILDLDLLYRFNARHSIFCYH